MGYSIDVADTIAGLDLLGKRVDGALKDIVGDAAHIFQALGMAKAPVGVVGNSTNAPGDLARSIDVSGPYGDVGSYEAQVGPTTIYGRQRELGGDIYPVVAKMLAFTKFGESIYTLHVHQDPEPYMKPAEDEGLPEVEAMAIERVADVIVSI